MNPVLIVLLFIAAFLLWASVAYAFPLIGRIISKYMKDIEKISEEFNKEDDLK
jgi:lantibiotic modifying enzyme